MEYDEVVLPPTSSSSSSVIPTEPNTAYVSTTKTTILTDQNVAYGVQSSNTWFIQLQCVIVFLVIARVEVEEFVITSQNSWTGCG